MSSRKNIFSLISKFYSWFLDDEIEQRRHISIHVDYTLQTTNLFDKFEEIRKFSLQI